MLGEGHHGCKPGRLLGRWLWPSSQKSQKTWWWCKGSRDGIERRTLVQNERWAGIWWAQWRNERGIGAPPRLPGTRLAWTPLWRRNFWTACKPITNIHPGLGDSYIVGLGGILVHAENCIFTSFGITFSSLGGTLSCWELFIVYFSFLSIWFVLSLLCISGNKLFLISPASSLCPGFLARSLLVSKERSSSMTFWHNSFSVYSCNQLHP